MCDDFVLYRKGRGNSPQPLRGIPGAYVLEHVPTAQSYAGSTDDLARRAKEHFSMLRHGKHSCEPLQEVFNQDPNPENYQLRCRVTNTRDEAFGIEENLLDQLRPTGRLLNVADDVRCSTRGRSMSPHQRQQLSEIKTGKKDSEQTRLKKVEILRTLHKTGSDNPAARGITVDGVRYPTINEAAQSLGVEKSTLRKRGLNPKFSNIVLD